MSFPPRIAVALLAVLAGCATAGRSSTPVDPASPSRAGSRFDFARDSAGSLRAPLGVATRRSAFEQLWRHIDRRYYDASHHGTDWRAVHGRYAPLVDTIASDTAFHRAMAAMVSELRDAHSRYLSPSEARAQRTRSATTVGVTLGELDGVPVIEQVVRGSGAERQGLRPGMRLDSINGEPARQRFAAVLGTDRSASSERARRAIAWRRLLAGDDSIVRLAASRDGERPVTATLRRGLLFSAPRVQARRFDDVLYTRWDGFRASIASSLADTLRAYTDARALIIDLRANGGGDAAETLRAIGLFLPKRVVTGEFFTRAHRRKFGIIPLRSTQALRAGGRPVWRKPVVVLTGTLTGSGAEMLAVVLQERGVARVVGDTTCGCLTAISHRTDIVGGGLLEMSDQGYRTARGTVVEGRGVIPDLVRPMSRDDLTRGRDPVLSAALALLAEPVSAESSASR